MRRAMLLIMGFGGMVLMSLVWVVQVQNCGLEPKVYVPRNTFYPRTVMGTELLAVEATAYSGPFWEDGSDELVTGVAALVVENRGGLLVAGGAVILELESDYLVFEISFLPPGGKVLVLEKDRKGYESFSAVTCYGWTKEAHTENIGLISVEAMGLTGLVLSNHTGCTVPSLQVHYKNFDPERGIFLGGIAYCVTQEDLMPREVRAVEPANFTAGQSRIVSVLQEMGR